MFDPTKEAVKQQFGASAANYVTSRTHARGRDLEALPALAGLDGTQLVLDVATATGHTALTLSPHARHVTGVDLTPQMLAESRQQAAQRGIKNVTFAEADAESLPFPDGSFDVVTCRIAAHHFPNVQAFCREAARVLRPAGRLIVIDNIAPESEPLDRFINEMEKLRDPSHFRAHRLSEWEGFFTAAGLTFKVVGQFATTMDREDWLARMRVPDEVATVLRQRFAEAPAEAKATFAITETGFDLHKAIMIGQRG